MQRKFDFLVIGSGIAGLSYALRVADKGTVALISKDKLNVTNTAYAQGGIASVTSESDSFNSHINDTFNAGDEINDEKAVEQVVKYGPKQIKKMEEWGMYFDRKEDNTYDLHKEGGHSQFRILHVKDRTGEEMQDVLIKKIKEHQNIHIFEKHFAIDIITQHHLGKKVTRRDEDIECYGAYVLNTKTKSVYTILSKITLIATGGIGEIYQSTTNPEIATGDGIAMVYRAKGVIEGMEFVQFHPTSLYNPKERPSFLITEALRGFGAVLRDRKGKKFMHKYDERASLAPRDIVARAIDNEMKLAGVDYLYLDVTHKPKEEIKTHFPGIYNKCLSLGYDIAKDYIPVVPAAHYVCGGIKVDLNGCSSIHRLYAVGECSSTGLHGANRLASNSLLEALVYAETAAEHGMQVVGSCSYKENIPRWNDDGTSLTEEMVLITQSRREMEQVMSNYVGIVRSNLRLKRALDRLAILYRETEDLYNRSVVSRKICELRNAINIGYLVIKMAMERRESRGLHYTIDYPAKHDADE